MVSAREKSLSKDWREWVSTVDAVLKVLVSQFVVFHRRSTPFTFHVCKNSVRKLAYAKFGAKTIDVLVAVTGGFFTFAPAPDGVGDLELKFTPTDSGASSSSAAPEKSFEARVVLEQSNIRERLVDYAISHLDLEIPLLADPEPDEPGLGPVAYDAPKLDTLQFLDHIKSQETFEDQISHVEKIAAAPPQWVDLEKCNLSEATLGGLRKCRIQQFFSHQADAITHAVHENKHVCVSTNTSSGKTLCYAVPILEQFLRDNSSRAFLLFPTKALAQDQLRHLSTLFSAVHEDMQVATFDGDLRDRKKRMELMETCSVFLTNPDMLHHTILPNHTAWKDVLINLKFVVLDEAHAYRGAFGSHVAMLMRRLRRIVDMYRRMEGLEGGLQFITCSATMSNGSTFFKQLTGLQDSNPHVVSKSGAQRGVKHFAIWNPPLMTDDPAAATRGKLVKRRKIKQENLQKAAEDNDHSKQNIQAIGVMPKKLPPGVGFKTRKSPYSEAAYLLAEAVRQRFRVVCFVKVRSLAEVILNEALQKLPADLHNRVASYRGGYNAEERRAIEKRLFNGNLLGVVATNALELGVDIGDLDMTYHVGYPGSMSSLQQQSGRAGRNGRPSVAILVALDSPIDQHFCAHPDALFSRNIEGTVADPSNELVLRGHLSCAASEQKMTDPEVTRYFGSPGTEVVRQCITIAPRTLVYQVDKETNQQLLAYCGSGAAKKLVDLRGIDPIQYTVKIRDTNAELEKVDQRTAHLHFYPGAICLHRNKTYQVQELCEKKLIAWVIPRDAKKLDYFTEARDHTRIDIIKIRSEKKVSLTDQTPLDESLQLSGHTATDTSILPTEGEISVCYGPVNVRLDVYGFRKKSKKDKKLIDLVEYQLPTVEYQSSAVWMKIPTELMQYAYDEDVHTGAIHTIEHLLLSLCPLVVSLGMGDFSCQHNRNDNDPSRDFLLLYETQRGGLGLTPQVQERDIDITNK